MGKRIIDKALIISSYDDATRKLLFENSYKFIYLGKFVRYMDVECQIHPEYLDGLTGTFYQFLTFEYFFVKDEITALFPELFKDSRTSFLTGNEMEYLAEIADYRAQYDYEGGEFNVLMVRKDKWKDAMKKYLKEDKLFFEDKKMLTIIKDDMTNLFEDILNKKIPER